MTNEFGKGYSSTRLKYIRRFYEVSTKCPSLTDELTYTHYCELIWFEDYNKINYYIKISVKQNLSVRELRTKIKNKEYERLDDRTKNKLIFNNEDNNIKDFIKHPIIIKNKNNYEEISEKILKQLILEDISSFMKELGNGFCYIDSEYKIKLGERYNYIDLLLYNIEFNCYVVIELKVTELKSEYIGQIQKYMNYIDINIRRINQEKTIGIIICKKDNHYVIEYASDERIYQTTYKLVKV
ncbi:MAG: DUF1016 family protein [Bacilli bacterium]|nr:DUF1016 family protein [Bacilli bacterium]